MPVLSEGPTQFSSLGYQGLLLTLRGNENHSSLSILAIIHYSTKGSISLGIFALQAHGFSRFSWAKIKSV